MYSAKELGGNQAQFYSGSLEKENIKRLELEAELRDAVEKHEFYLVYQPQYDINSEKIIAVEALLRWKHPKRGALLPIDFIPLAEEIGLFVILGDWIIKTACLQNKKWQNDGLNPVVMCVNITTQQFKQPEFIQSVQNILTEINLDQKYLELELTENIIINSSEAEEKIKELRSLGVSIAIDDFGTGNSGFSYLRKLPINHIKIDQSFVQNAETNEADSVIIQAIIMIANHLNMGVIAEGVETKSQLDFLKVNHCGGVQGFYFSRPVSPEKIKLLLSDDKHQQSAR